MIAVIIAGGQGTRLWPLSTSEKPKHLLRLTGKNSLLQEAFQRAVLCAETIYVVTDSSHAELVAKQLPELKTGNLIVEPSRRGTASCIVLALAHIAQLHKKDRPIVFFHADHHIQNREGFAETVQFAAKCALTYDSIALIGVSPDAPVTGYGYIKFGRRLDGAFEVDSFKEKPTKEAAEKYVDSGKYLWNMGLFAGTLDIFEREMKQHAKSLERGFQHLCKDLEEAKDPSKTYLKFKNEPIDTALIEKSTNVVVPATFDWVDIGNYKDLHTVMPKKDDRNNSIKGAPVEIIDSTNCMVFAYNKPIAVIGLKNVVVIDTPDGLLVCHQEHAQTVKEAAAKFQNNK